MFGVISLTMTEKQAFKTGQTSDPSRSMVECCPDCSREGTLTIARYKKKKLFLRLFFSPQRGHFKKTLPLKNVFERRIFKNFSETVRDIEKLFKIKIICPFNYNNVLPNALVSLTVLQTHMFEKKFNTIPLSKF